MPPAQPRASAPPSINKGASAAGSLAYAVHAGGSPPLFGFSNNPNSGLAMPLAVVSHDGPRVVGGQVCSDPSLANPLSRGQRWRMLFECATCFAVTALPRNFTVHSLWLSWLPSMADGRPSVVASLTPLRLGNSCLQKREGLAKKEEPLVAPPSLRRRWSPFSETGLALSAPRSDCTLGCRG